MTKLAIILLAFSNFSATSLLAMSISFLGSYPNVIGDPEKAIALTKQTKLKQPKGSFAQEVVM